MKTVDKMNSYLSVLKRTLFSISEPSAPPTTENAKALKENWIYIHSEENSTTDEVINLNETFESGASQNIVQDPSHEMAEEIKRNRELWLKKRSSASQKWTGSSTSNIKRTKLKPRTRKRSPTQELPANPEDSSSQSDTNSVTEEKASDKSKTSSAAFTVSPKLRSAKRSKMQTKHNQKRVVRTLQQPAAKGMC